MNKINKNMRNIEITKEPTGTNENVAILTIGKTETAEQTIKEILTGKKKKHNAMHVGLKTTKLNIVAKTPIYLYHTEKRSI